MKKEIGIVIKLCRIHCCLTQCYVAYKLNLTINSYANIENGRVDINTSRLLTLAHLFGLKDHEVLELAERAENHNDENWVPDALRAIIKS